MEQIGNIMFDESKQRDLILEDEEEDFLDDGSIFIVKLKNRHARYLNVMQLKLSNF